MKKQKEVKFTVILKGKLGQNYLKKCKKEHRSMLGLARYIITKNLGKYRGEN